MNRFEMISVNIGDIRNNDRNLYHNNIINRPYSTYEKNQGYKTRKNNRLSKKSGNNFYNNNDNFQSNNGHNNTIFKSELNFF